MTPPMPFAQPDWKLRAGPSGVLLFDRTTGLNVLLDGMEVPPRLWAAAPRQVSIALTNACDLSCSYCYAPKIPASLSTPLVTNWLVELNQSGCIGVGFGGGEPTLHRDFARICRFAASRTRLAVTFTSHGHHLNREMVARLRGSVHFVRISMDGVGETYESLRGRSFSGLVARLRQIRDLAPFGINYVVNRRTIGDLDLAACLAVDQGASELLLLPEQGSSGSTGIDAETSRKLSSWVARYSGPIRLTISSVGAEGLPTCDPFESDVGLRSFAHIDAFGNLRKSSFHVEAVPIGPDGVIKALSNLSNGL